MRWTTQEEELIKNSYLNNLPITEFVKRLNRSKRAIYHKISRLNISRNPIFMKDPNLTKMSRNLIDKRYYDKNKKQIYLKKKLRRNRLKEELVNFLGGKCSFCGYNKCMASLDFHHVENKKDANLSKLFKNSSREKILKEVKRCILLCANCHRELHHKGL
jgi:uncharacterized membrane protein YheB (UPF0754 family)